MTSESTKNDASQQQADTSKMSRIELLKAGLSGANFNRETEAQPPVNEMKTDTRGSFNKKVKF